jgi:hypothetical protein
MSLSEYAPGKSSRIQLTGGCKRCSMVWNIFSKKNKADIYVSPGMFGGAVKLSLHGSGSWQAGLTEESPAHLRSGASRHWDIWKRGGELAPGMVRAWYLLIPDQELRVADYDNKAYKLPPVGPEHAASIEFLIMSNEGPTVDFDVAHIVGRWRLAGRNESCLVVARRIPWTSEQRTWANFRENRPSCRPKLPGFRTIRNTATIFTATTPRQCGLDLNSPQLRKPA